MTDLNKYDSLGHRIKAQRLNMDMTQEQLAVMMCVPKSTISAYENNKVDIKSSVILELSRVLKTTPNQLLGYMEESDSTIDSIITLLRNIHDERLKAILYSQIYAVMSISL